MPAIKEELLKKCHKDFLELCFGNLSLEEVKNQVSEKITGFGTNINEKIQSLDAFISLLNLQREESTEKQGTRFIISLPINTKA